MLNDIMDAITKRLDELFGDRYRIYTDGVGQGLEEPCFFVQFLEPSEKPMIGQRYFRQEGLCIQYLTEKSEQPSRELNRVAEILMEGMEYITLSDGSLLRGTGMSTRSDMEQQVLSFFVSYNMFVVKPKTEEEPMGGLETKTQLGRSEN